MTLYLKLFLTFLKIGAVSFGGGYAMVSLLSEAVTDNGWLSEAEFVNLIAVSESTPGPLAVNMATFVGASQGGFFGALAATAGVVLPSFIIILAIASVFSSALKYAPVHAFMSGVRPCIGAMVTAVAVIMGLNNFFGFSSSGGFNFDSSAVLIFIIIALLAFVFKRLRKKSPSPIFLLAASALLGIIFY